MEHHDPLSGFDLSGWREKPMQDQLVLAVVTALAAKGGEAIITGGGSAFARLYRFLCDRFRANGSGTASLEAVVTGPGDTERAELADAIAQLLTVDPELRPRLEALWSGARAESAASSGGVINQFSGTADRVVQARDIQGDVSF
ncbi:hypothetical protein [Plantactinospora endophytica]|uniref:hypothetical protein n=1 Tax=Plantactinospora endophytica TaxID=673535 RepID=UPI0019441D95|nr:hypothetical protein [Plantactinospora endophytica]